MCRNRRLASAPDFAWTLPLQVKISRDRSINVYPQYTKVDTSGFRLFWPTRCSATARLPPDADGVYLHRGNDYSPRLLLLPPAEAWALPTVSGKRDADPTSPYRHRLRWTPLVDLEDAYDLADEADGEPEVAVGELWALIRDRRTFQTSPARTATTAA